MAEEERLQEPHPGAPRWVKIAVVVVVLVVLVLVVSKLAGVEHGPERHGGDRSVPARSEGQAPPPGADGHTPPAGVPDHGAPQP